MAMLVFGMNQSLDGYVDDDRFETGPALFRHWIEQVSGLAGSLYGLIDQYRLYLHAVVLGGGAPFFAGPRPPLRLVSTDPMDEGVIRLTYAPA